MLRGTADAVKEASVHVTFWKNGFSIEDGPLREYANLTDEDKAFLKSMERGECPKELEALARAKEERIMVSVVDKKNEDFVAPAKPSYVAFSGSGHSLRCVCILSSIIIVIVH